MTSPTLTRRQLLIAGCSLGLGKALRVTAEEPLSKTADTEPYPSGAGEALARLKKGNQRFRDGVSRHTHETASWRRLLVETQKPFATVLGCSDSRVPPELIFDAGFGDLFTIRVAGNIIAEDVIGTLQYGVAHLHTPLVVVLGHEGCGAVGATLDEMLNKTKELEHIESLIQLIKPGLRELDLNLDRAALLRAAVEANVRWSMRQLSTSPEGARALREKRVGLVGGVYDLATGRVRFLD
ncbi:carbonic anhydrase [Nitrosospira sp. Nsp2]|uniref:carbonic anhydrase n=1 Tax=Nitrosospira sp. Nsp2 TaxID=136548 RepID=UPI000D32415C|nr:carbonic anhydrase [Nitrosospira sp. Nsp2]PTR17348.1 carbonic anhydrase [Nitrosospira sp. Nsp2]